MLPVIDFKWAEDISEFDESFTKSYNDENNQGYFLEVDVQYPEKVHDLYNDLPFLPEKMNIEKVKKPVANLHYRDEYSTHLKILKQELNHGLVLKEFLESLSLIKKLG